MPNFELIRAISDMDVWYRFWSDIYKNVEWIDNDNICLSEKNQGHRGHRKVKCEISQALVMINMYVKFNVHSSYAKVIVLKVANRRTDGRAWWRQ